MVVVISRYRLLLSGDKFCYNINVIYSIYICLCDLYFLSGIVVTVYSAGVDRNYTRPPLAIGFGAVLSMLCSPLFINPYTLSHSMHMATRGMTGRKHLTALVNWFSSKPQSSRRITGSSYSWHKPLMKATAHTMLFLQF